MQLTWWLLVLALLCGGCEIGGGVKAKPFIMPGKDETTWRDVGVWVEKDWRF